MPFCFQRLPTKYFCRAFASWEKHFPGPIFLKNKILTNNLNIISLHWAWPFNKTTVKIHALCSCCNCSYNPSNIQHSSFMSLCHCCNPFMPCTWFSGPLLKIWLPISAGAPLPEAILAPTRTTRPPHQEALHSCWHIRYPTQSSPRAKLWLTARGKPRPCRPRRAPLALKLAHFLSRLSITYSAVFTVSGTPPNWVTRTSVETIFSRARRNIKGALRATSGFQGSLSACGRKDRAACR